MRLPNPLLQHLSIGKRGAQMVRGDGELTVPPQYNIASPVPAPVFAMTSGSGNQEQSYFTNVASVQAGVSGGQVVDGLPMKAGVWKLHGHAVLQFSGTVNVGNTAEVRLVDPNGGFFDITSIFLFSSPLSFTIPILLEEVHFVADGWLVRLVTPATVAGDNLVAQGRVYHERLV
jgi:hypothetical protein